MPINEAVSKAEQVEEYDSSHYPITRLVKHAINYLTIPDLKNEQLAINATYLNGLPGSKYQLGISTSDGVDLSEYKLTLSDGSSSIKVDTTNKTAAISIADTHYTAYMYVGAASTSSNSSTSNPYLKLYENGSLRSQKQIKGSGATSVSSDSSGNITISSTNTTYSDATTSAHGLMTAADKIKLNGLDSTAYALKFDTDSYSVGSSSYKYATRIIQDGSNSTGKGGIAIVSDYNYETENSREIAYSIYYGASYAELFNNYDYNGIYVSPDTVSIFNSNKGGTVSIGSFGVINLNSSDIYLNGTVHGESTASFGGNLTAAKIIKSAGQSYQFLKADGSVDSTTYLNQNYFNLQYKSVIALGQVTSTSLTYIGSVCAGNRGGFLVLTGFGAYSTSYEGLFMVASNSSSSSPGTTYSLVHSTSNLVGSTIVQPLWANTTLYMHGKYTSYLYAYCVIFNGSTGGKLYSALRSSSVTW